MIIETNLKTEVSRFMNLDFRKIVELLEIDAPVHFTPKSQLNKKDYVFCLFMGNEEKSAIKAGTHTLNGNYDTSDIGLHFPDIEIEEYYELESNRNPFAINSHIGKISNQMIVYPTEIPLLFALHCILHEYGHWIYFLSTGMSSYDYCEEEKKVRQPYEKMVNNIYKMPDCSLYKRIAAKKYEEEIYSQFPSEKSANQYAAEHILEAVTKIRNFLGYSEQDLCNQTLTDM